MSQPRTRIEIWSDIACPWCYIGERRFFRALDAASAADTYPPISHFQVRAATVVDGHAVVGGNTEYQLPEALHGIGEVQIHA